MDDSDVPPDRVAIERMWESLISCSVTRAEAREWARPWVEERDEEIADPMSRKALQHLHGFGLRRESSGGTLVSESFDGEYLHEARDIGATLIRWRDACAEYDRDPRGYIARVKSEALRSLSE
jgi:hypothetical protein